MGQHVFGLWDSNRHQSLDVEPCRALACGCQISLDTTTRWIRWIPPIVNQQSFTCWRLTTLRNHRISLNGIPRKEINLFKIRHENDNEFHELKINTLHAARYSKIFPFLFFFFEQLFQDRKITCKKYITRKEKQKKG